MTAGGAALTGSSAVHAERTALLPAVYHGLLAALLWLYFFNAVLDRITEFLLGRAMFTAIYYLCLAAALGIRLLVQLRRGEDQPLALWALGFLVFATVLGAAYGDPVASVFGVKQFFIGIVYLLLFAGQPFPARTVLAALLLVQAYALFQGIYFLTALQLPPWDMIYVRQMIDSWQARNLYQDGLIRPFATFASFSEYQIVVHVLVIGLFLLRDRLRAGLRPWTWVLLATVVAVDVLLPDRTPIMMGIILLATTWLGMAIVHGARAHPVRPIVGALLLGAFASLFWVVPAMFGDSEVRALHRLAEAFRFWEAETVRERAATAWALALEVIRTTPEGAGPAAVATAYDPSALTPHNTYFLFAIGYSVVFPLLFFGWLAVAFRRLFLAMGAADGARARLGFAALGLTLAYMVSSVFNATFSSYMGVAYFLLLQWLHAAMPAGEAERA
jgi:hypothetical protein